MARIMDYGLFRRRPTRLTERSRCAGWRRFSRWVFPRCVGFSGLAKRRQRCVALGRLGAALEALRCVMCLCLCVCVCGCGCVLLAVIDCVLSCLGGFALCVQGNLGAAAGPIVEGTRSNVGKLSAPASIVCLLPGRAERLSKGWRRRSRWIKLMSVRADKINRK